MFFAVCSFLCIGGLFFVCGFGWGGGGEGVALKGCSRFVF